MSELNYLFRRRPWYASRSKHGTNGETCTSLCATCGGSPTMYVSHRKGYCALHKEDAHRRQADKGAFYEAVNKYRRTIDVLLTEV